jgi:Dna[CI] antecedent, DciA
VLKLSQLLGQWQPPAGEPRDPVALLAAGWEEIVGAGVAKSSRPAKLTGDTLLVTVRSSAWSHQLSLLAETILTAVRARLPRAGIEKLRFRVGRLSEATKAAPAPRRQAAPSRRVAERPESATLEEAMSRLREDVAASRRAKQAAGWKECAGCGALVAPEEEALCIVCADARARERAGEAARLLFEAPWLGYSGTATLVSGLSVKEYEAIRSRLLAAWWETLSRARAAKRLSRDGRERSIASSYVLLRSKLPPEKIVPATVRNVLGDELHDLIYGTERD